jgi:hypothetical protein
MASKRLKPFGVQVAETNTMDEELELNTNINAENDVVTPGNVQGQDTAPAEHASFESLLDFVINGPYPESEKVYALKCRNGLGEVNRTR